MRNLVGCVSVLVWLGWSATASAFCGFYVGKADTTLFNQASSVVMVRHDGKTVLTMSNDVQGAVTEFAMVVPVPTVLKKGQIHVGNQAVLDHLDAYASPRLVEYFDPNPCERQRRYPSSKSSSLDRAAPMKEAFKLEAKKLGVTIEATYIVGEYDILILSAQESQGLETWLTGNGYRMPPGASSVLGSYLKQGMKFFVAKVNLKNFEASGFTRLRPLQMAFETEKFMLPIRLGTVNAQGSQDLFMHFITKRGRVETTNYRTIKLPEGKELPVYIKDEFPAFYRDLFAEQVKQADMRGVFLEYAWNMNACDPCAADPLSRQELQDLGVFWLTGEASRGQAQEVFLTRLHVRYDAAHFPEDLQFQETPNQRNFQARYVLRHPWTGTEQCAEAERYREVVRVRQEREAQTLASLTGWRIADIRNKAGLSMTRDRDQPVNEVQHWWDGLWKQ